MIPTLMCPIADHEDTTTTFTTTTTEDERALMTAASNDEPPPSIASLNSLIERKNEDSSLGNFETTASRDIQEAPPADGDDDDDDGGRREDAADDDDDETLHPATTTTTATATATATTTTTKKAPTPSSSSQPQPQPSTTTSSQQQPSSSAQREQQQQKTTTTTKGSSTTTTTSQQQKDKGETPKGTRRENGLRRGKWTVEEEAYANRLIHEFKLGLLPLTDGTTLRTFLSKLLHCDPMRISKKFVGSNCIGKQVFRRRQADMDRLSPEDIKRSRYELAELERRFLSRVAQTNRSAKTAVASQPTNAAASLPQKKPEQPDFTRRQPVLAPWLLPPHANAAAQPVRATPGAGAVAIASVYGLAPPPASYGAAGSSLQQQHHAGGGGGRGARHQQQQQQPPPTGESSQQQQQRWATNYPRHHGAAPAQDVRRPEPPPAMGQQSSSSGSAGQLLRRRQLIDRRLPSDEQYGNLQNAHASQASLTSFDLPSFQSMDNLASLDTGTLGLSSPWPSTAKLNRADSFLLDPSRASSSNLAGLAAETSATAQVAPGPMAAAASSSSSSGRNVRREGLPSWPSFSALVGGLDDTGANDAPAPAASSEPTTTTTTTGGAEETPPVVAPPAAAAPSSSSEAASASAASASAEAEAATSSSKQPDSEQQPSSSSAPSSQPPPSSSSSAAQQRDEEEATTKKIDEMPSLRRTSLGQIGEDEAETGSPRADAKPPRHHGRFTQPKFITSSAQQQIRRQNRNSSVENFLSLVRSGTSFACFFEKRLRRHPRARGGPPVLPHPPAARRPARLRRRRRSRRRRRRAKAPRTFCFSS